MTILLSAGSAQANDTWQQQLQTATPIPIATYPNIANPDAIRYALLWQHPHGDLHRYRNLAAIFSLGAGVEHLTTDPQLANLPIIRLVDPAMSTAMAHYCLYWTIAYQRRFDLYNKQQQQGQWQPQPCPATQDFSVGILGLGQIGSAIATAIANQGYAVSGWSQSAKSIPRVTSFVGEQQRKQFLAGIHLLINCLPLTPATTNLIDSNFLAQMNQGSFIINIGRGATLVEQDLCCALDSGQIAAATLDVIDQEPLAAHSAYWQQPSLHITPHISGPTFPATATAIILANIERIEQGQQPFPLYDSTKGY